MQNAAFKLGLILLALFVYFSAIGAEKPSKPKCHCSIECASCQQQQASKQVWMQPFAWQTQWPTIISKQQPPTPDDHKRADESATESKDDHLYERRNAIASEIQAHYAHRVFQIGIFGTIVSAAAAIFTGWAAWAAAAAARAAFAATKEAGSANEIARDTAERQLRAYMVPMMIDHDKIYIKERIGVEAFTISGICGYKFTLSFKN